MSLEYTGAKVLIRYIVTASVGCGCVSLVRREERRANRGQPPGFWCHLIARQEYSQEQTGTPS